MTTLVFGNNTGDDFSGTEDNMLRQNAQTTNNGGWQYARLGKPYDGDIRHVLLSFSGLSNLPASVSVSSAIVSLSLDSAATGITITADFKRLLRDWVELESTWTIWSTGNNWTTLGATSEGNDISATLSDTMDVATAVGVYYHSDDSAQLHTDIENFASGTYPNYGWHLEKNGGYSGDYVRNFITHEGADGERPYLTVVYSTNSPTIESYTDINEADETTSFVVTKPTGLEVDDLLLLICAKDDDPVIDLPSGWTRATASVAGGDHATDILYKIADAADVAASNFTFTGDSEQYVGRLYRISNVDTSTPIDAQDATGNTGTSTAPIANSVTTVTDGALVFAVTGMDDDDTPYSLDTAGWYEDLNSISNTGNGTCGIVIGVKYQDTLGATGNVAFTTNASEGWAAVQFAIRPASSGTEITGTLDELTLTEYNASTNAETSFTTTLDSLTLTAYNATINAETSFTTALDALTLAEQNATVNAETSFTTTLDQLTITTYQAGVSLGLIIDAGVDSLVLTENNATVKIDTSFTTTLDALTLTENQSTVNAETSFTATLDSLTLTEYPSTVNVETSFTTTLDQLTITEYQSTVEVGGDTSINAIVDELALTEYPASINAETSFTATLDSLTLTENQATLNAETSFTATLDVLTLTEHAASINAETSFTTNLDALTLTEYQATVELISGTNINADVQVLNLTEYKATIAAVEAAEESGTAGGYYKKKYSRPLRTLDYYEKLAKELIEEEEEEERKLEKLESKLSDKQITVLLNKDPELDRLKSEQKIISAQVEIIEIKSKITQTQQVLNRIEHELNEAARLAAILKDDEVFLRHYLKVS